MAVNNSTVLSRCWLAGTNDFQQRITMPSQSDISGFIQDITAPMNNDLWNEFCNILVNRIGMQIVNEKRWNNPLTAVFGKGNMLYGNTIQELAPKWLRAHTYDNVSTRLLQKEKPDFAQIFHSVNRKEFYKFSFAYDEFRAAVADGAEGFGVNSLLDSLITAQLNSADYDEYIIMKQIIAEYEDKWGFFNVQLSAAPTNEATAKELLKDIRTYASKFRFPSTLYNAGLYEDLPIFERNPDNIVLMTTPDVLACVDVDALAAAFNIDRAEIRYQIVEIDEFPIPNTYAILTTKDFYIAYDYVYQTNQFFDPEALCTNYYLHTWQLLSVSPFVPCVRFSTDASTAVPVITETLSAFAINMYEMDGTAFNPVSDVAAYGMELRMAGALTGTLLDGDNNPAPTTLALAPESFAIDSIAAWIKYGDSDGNEVTEPLDDSPSTYVDRLGILHIQNEHFAPADNIIAALSLNEYAIGITITAHCTYTNPSGSGNSLNPATITINVEVVE